MRSWNGRSPFGRSQSQYTILWHRNRPLPRGILFSLSIENPPLDRSIGDGFPIVIDRPDPTTKSFSRFPAVPVELDAGADRGKAALDDVKNLGRDSVKIDGGHRHRWPDVNGMKMTDAAGRVVLEAPAPFECNL